MERTTQNPNEANLEDLQLRAKSQCLYAVGGAIVVAITGIVLVVVFWNAIGLQNSLLIGAATIFGVVILVISAVDMKARDRGFNRHRDEQKIMEELSEKYRMISKATSDNAGVSPTSDEESPTTRSGK